MLTYKKRNGDKGSSNENNRSVLLGWWNERKDRPSPLSSPTTTDDAKMPAEVDFDFHQDLPGLPIDPWAGPDTGNI